MKRLTLCLLLPAALAGAAAPALSGVPASRTVTVRDGSLAPATLRLATGALMEFVNAGRRPHTIRAERNVWAPIVLRPGARAGLRLHAPGRYPYTVDGRLKGELIVGTPIAGFRPPPGSVQTTVEHAYAVRIDARIHHTITVDGKVEDADLRWTMRMPRLVLRIDAVGAQLSFGNRVRGPGTFSGRFEFADSRSSSSPCRGEVAYAGLPTEILLQGSRDTRRATVSLDAGLSPAGASRYDAARKTAQTRAGCSAGNDAEWLDETTPVDRGVRIHHPPSFSISAWDTRWTAEGRGTPFPLAAILAGRSFSVSSGNRGFEPRPCGSGCTEAFEGSVRYVFTALRPRR